jgi:hypothetical protein
MSICAPQRIYSAPRAGYRKAKQPRCIPDTIIGVAGTEHKRNAITTGPVIDNRVN